MQIAIQCELLNFSLKEEKIFHLVTIRNTGLVLAMSCHGNRYKVCPLT